MSRERVGATKKFSDNWEAIFGGKRRKSTKKKAAKKPAAKKAPAKKKAAKKSRRK